MTNRRKFIGAAAGSLFLLPVAVVAQSARKVVRIGWLTPDVVELHSRTFREAMRDLGYVEGQTLVIEMRSADDKIERLPGLAEELVRAKVDVIVAVSPPAIVAARKATDSIPIVMAFWGAGGLLESGFVANLARPGGNVTGVSMLAAELDAKRLELLLQAVPKARKVGVLDPGRGYTLTEVQRVADGAGVQLRVTPVGGGKDGRRRRPDGLWADVRRTERARRHVRAANSERREAVRPSHRAAKQVRAGRQPQDATALGVALPRSLLLRADRVIAA